jgi:pyruvate/2-oxoglutarate/acetoin dehydrogenase E1 component/TPP-dependent pyruvate/acetoin dehydrogenase alpha subunit
MENTVFKPLFSLDAPEGEGDELFKNEVLNDYYICCVSREASIIARKEVLTGKGKFGITGDGKELAQVALAKAIRKGDWRAGYYRDQTLLFALGEASIEQYFAQLYADTNNDPFSGGRQMMTHFASKLVDEEGNFTDHLSQFNSSSDVSCTAGQMGRAVGLALASKKYRNLKTVPSERFSAGGEEVVICTIGDGSTSEGIFWESVNAACVKAIPIAFCVWDDGYAISVPTKIQTTKGSISRAMEGLLYEELEGSGMRIYVAKAWDYVALCEMFASGIKKIRSSQVPALFHVQEATQPLGHSTSGSHERYKPSSRILWEREMDCILAFQAWIVHNEIADLDTLQKIRKEAKEYARECRKRAWNQYIKPILEEREVLKRILQSEVDYCPGLQTHLSHLVRLIHPALCEIIAIAKNAYYELAQTHSERVSQLAEFIREKNEKLRINYGTHLYTEGAHSALQVSEVHPIYDQDASKLNGYEILNRFFDKAFSKYPNLLAFGEDVGRLGDVNQGMMGMQEKFGSERVFDAGLREWTILGQAIGLAMRGFRPIAEVQYLDYLVYGMAALTDDLATLSYRTNGIQKAPAIIRTRGHRLEGIWHTGSPMGMLLHSLRGIYILVPRNMVQAAGMYATMLQSQDPCLMIECLNGYRLKERIPANIGDYTIPIGISEVLQEGSDLTLVTYGACVRIAQAAIEILDKQGVSVELIDVQTLIPFDLNDAIFLSLKKTNRILFLDEDVPGGATAYMLQEVIEKRGGFDYLEISARTLTGKAHRSPYGSDGDYYAKPNVEDVVETINSMMHESDPSQFPLISIS